MAYGFPFQTPLKLFFYSRMMSLKKELNKRSPHVISCIFFLMSVSPVPLRSYCYQTILKDLDSHPVRETKKQKSMGINLKQSMKTSSANTV